MWTLFGMTPKMRKNPSCAKLKRKINKKDQIYLLLIKQTKKEILPSINTIFHFALFLSLNLKIFSIFWNFFKDIKKRRWDSSPFIPLNSAKRLQQNHHTNFLISIHSVEKSSNTNFCTTSFSPWYKKKDADKAKNILKNKQKSELLLRYFDFEL